MNVRKSKANTACNTCRARKTRCDGERPACSYCRSTGVDCVYRATGSEPSAGLNEQQAVQILERLDRLELRMGSLTRYEAPEWTWNHQSTDVALRSEAAQDPKSSCTQIPFFHTASSHKMIHYWPRINMSATLGAFNPLKYIENTESGGIAPLFASGSTLDELAIPTIQMYLTHMQESCTGIDYLLCLLLQRHSAIFSAFPSATSQTSSPAVPLSPATPPFPESGPSLSIQGCSCQMLLTLTLAARGACSLSRASSSQTLTGIVAETVRKEAFRGACAKLGELFFVSDDDDSIIFLILGAHLLMVEACPMGALKLIQAAGDRLGRSGKRQVNEPWWTERFQDCLKLHHIVERQVGSSQSPNLQGADFLLNSDILLTMDGLPSETAFVLLNSLPATKTLREVETGYMNLSVSEIAKKKLAETLSEATYSLTNIQNRVLAQMYTIEQAYSQPSVLAHPLTVLKSELTRWFDNLPLEWHFPRDVSGAMTIPNPTPDLPDFLAYLRAKYYILEFLMCRPILYYIAHESFEAPMDRHTSNSPSDNSESEGRPFWVYDACHRCLQCAGLLILGRDADSPQKDASRRDWFELHMIWGAALTLVLSLATPALAKFLPKHGSVMDTAVLVARAEAILLQEAKDNCVPAKCLEILRNVQRNLLDMPQDSSPMSFMIT